MNKPTNITQLPLFFSFFFSSTNKRYDVVKPWCITSFLLRLLYWFYVSSTGPFWHRPSVQRERRTKTRKAGHCVFARFHKRSTHMFARSPKHTHTTSVWKSAPRSRCDESTLPWSYRPTANLKHTVDSGSSGPQLVALPFGPFLLTLFFYLGSLSLTHTYSLTSWCVCVCFPLTVCYWISFSVDSTFKLFYPFLRTAGSWDLLSSVRFIARQLWYDFSHVLTTAMDKRTHPHSTHCMNNPLFC